jgi:alpha-glucosidase
MRTKTISLFTLFISLIIICSCIRIEKTHTLLSPDKIIKVEFQLKNGIPYYAVQHKNYCLLDKSRLGFELKDLPDLDSNFIIKNITRNFVQDKWEQPWGEQQWVENNYNEIIFDLQEKNGLQRSLSIAFRVFDDGVAFRYVIPQQKHLNDVEISDEKTEFAFSENHPSWWIKAYQFSRYELLYQKSGIDEIDTVHTPFTIEAEDGSYFCIHEANLTDYASMTLVNAGGTKLKCDLIPWSDGVKVKKQTPIQTPWRMVQIAQTGADLIESNMMLNLNEPNRLGDVSSWVKPTKYIGIWWGIHIDLYTFGEGERHGATTERAMKYVDFAAANGFDEVLVEGWNKGFTERWWRNYAPEMNFTQPTDDYDIEKVQRYAQLKGITIQGYHETAANIDNYLSQIDSAFALLKRLGYRSVKIGQVGEKLNGKEWHHGQFGVQYYRKVLQKAAEYKLMVNFHEPIKDCGERRTYPNMMTREGARGQEYNAWSPDGGNPPGHTCILPFTRLLGAPMDYTPGIFGLTIPSKPNNQISSTLSQQLALYVIIYSPMQMAADIIENYENHPAFQFIKDVPVDWKKTKVLEAKIGEYITIVRQDRNSDDFYLASITNERKRETKMALSFLEKDVTYQAQIYADGDNAQWKTNPADYKIYTQDVTADSELSFKLAEGGGVAVRFIKRR